jgi:predicted PurR-regulated permease PerM
MNTDQRPKNPDIQHHVSLESRYFLLIFCVSAIFLGRILWPFWSILVLSFLLASLFRPTYLFLHSRKLSAPLASIFTCVLIVVIVFIPLLLFIGALSNEAFSLYQWAKDAGLGIKIHAFFQSHPLAAQFQTYLQGLGLEFEPTQFTDNLSSLVKSGVLFLYNQASSWAANILKFLALFVIMILVIFFLLIDQEKLVTFFVRLSPLPDHEDRLLLARFEATANAILKGTIVCGLIQGIIAGVVFAMLGLNAPILWGCIMAVVACLPIVGIGLVIIIPTSVILAINGQPGTGLFLSLFYMLLSFSIEYIIKPKMVGDQVKMHTLLVFLSLMGGLAVYGVLGIIYGPLIITAFLTLSDLYLDRYDFSLQKKM